MILHEYAVEPEALVGWDRFRYITEKIGFQYGRLISRFPKSWARAVNVACEDLKDVERKRITEKLIKIKESRMIASRRPYDPSLDWQRNAENQHTTSPFHCIVARANPRGQCCTALVDEIDEDHALFRTAREEKVVRVASQLAGEISLLLANSREILFVDPYFDPNRPKWRNCLGAFLKAAISNENKLVRCEYHLRDSPDSPGYKEFESRCNDALPQIIPQGVVLRLIRWQDDNVAEDLHARYILTDCGGVRIEHGLDEHLGGASTDVSLLDLDLWRERWDQYQISSSPFTFVDDVVVSGCCLY